jgi:prepilin-type N-terminal cleavage/methylation domain-containing protein
MTRRTRVRGFTLLEMIVVLALVSVLMLLIAASLWGAVKIERADAAVLARIQVQSQLADLFREDISSALECPDAVGETAAGPECLILKVGDGRHVVYRWYGDRLTRRELGGADETPRALSVGGEFIAAEFERGPADSRDVHLILRETRRPVPSRSNWTLRISAALGGDQR